VSYLHSERTAIGPKLRVLRSAAARTVYAFAARNTYTERRRAPYVWTWVCMRACIYVRGVYGTDCVNTRAAAQQRAAARADTRLLPLSRRDPFISRSSSLSQIFRVLRSSPSRIIGASIRGRKFRTPDSLAFPSSVCYLFSRTMKTCVKTDEKRRGEKISLWHDRAAPE